MLYSHVWITLNNNFNTSTWILMRTRKRTPKMRALKMRTPKMTFTSRKNYFTRNGRRRVLVQENTNLRNMNIKLYIFGSCINKEKLSHSNYFTVGAKHLDRIISVKHHYTCGYNIVQKNLFQKCWNMTDGKKKIERIFWRLWYIG